MANRIGWRPINGLLVVFCWAASAYVHESPVLLREERYKTFYKIARSPLMRLPKRQAWKKVVPEVRAITIKSSADGTPQPALFYSSGSEQSRPLLLVLHSWSADYLQHFSIPYGIWAVANDWVFMHPDYRGAYTNPQATASEAAIQDILDALEYAREHAKVDPARVYITGFSGGAMTTLIMVGRYPELWAGAVAWVPVYDLVQWYYTTKGARHDYSHFIASSCGGPPEEGTAAYRECKRRSVSSYLRGARGKAVQVYIATGIEDNFVPPGHSLQAFNDLAGRREYIDEEQIRFVNEHHELPPGWPEALPDSLYRDAGRRLLFERTSRNVILKIFDGRHDVIYNAGLLWLSRQRKRGNWLQRLLR